MCEAPSGRIVIALAVMIKVVGNVSFAFVSARHVVAALEEEGVTGCAVSESPRCCRVVAVRPVADGLLEFSTRVHQSDYIALSIVDRVVGGATGEALVDEESFGCACVVAG